MHTYLTIDNNGVSLSADDGINVVLAYSGDMKVVDLLLLDFYMLLEGFAVGQDIPSRAEEYGYSVDTQFYKKTMGV